jgi:hypothetical protein
MDLVGEVGWASYRNVPSSLDNIDGKQTLRQTFDGRHSVVLSSG